MIEIELFLVVIYLIKYCIRLKIENKKLRRKKSTIIILDKLGNRRTVNLLDFSCPNKNCKLYGNKCKRNIQKRKIHGTYRDRLWLKCNECGKEFSETKGTAYFNKKKPIKKIEQIVHYLSEGGEIRKGGRIFNVSKDTILSYHKSASAKAKLVNKLHEGMNFAFLQFDEIWSFIFKKDKNLKLGEEQTKGSFWGFISFAFPHRFIINIQNGKRDDETTLKFVENHKNHIDITKYVLIMTDGFKSYFKTLLSVFGKIVHYKIPEGSYERILPETLLYGQVIKKRENGKIVDIIYKRLNGYKAQFDRMLKLAGCSKITTSLIERANLTLRHLVGRFKRKGMGFSKKVKNHEDALQFFQAFYNYVCPNRGLGKEITPAMSLGITKRVWTIDDIMRFQLDVALS
jgi:IS1 family transposase/transposase-like protein